MKFKILAGAACAALMGVALPAVAATVPSHSPIASAAEPIDAFYQARAEAPLWLKDGAASAPARELIDVLKRAALDGLPSGPALAQQAELLITRARAGDADALAAADRLLSGAWVQYVQALQSEPAGMTYADDWVRPRRDTATTILAKAAAATSLAAHVREVAFVNPIYAELRAAAWSTAQANGGYVDPRVLASLDRARDAPPGGRFILVDTAGARLYIIENGQIADSMKVIVGKAGPSTETPMMASTIYYATLNPYWHVSPELIRSLIARNVIDQGFEYLRSRGYQVIAADGSGQILDPKSVDWQAVAQGRETVQVRQLPGPANSMGQMKIAFPNSEDIYLHDTPNKSLFDQDERTLSHGCIRLEDAERLGRWLLGREPRPASAEPELNVLLPKPVPVYLTYLTARADGGQLSYVDDIYGRDSSGQQVAALR